MWGLPIRHPLHPTLIEGGHEVQSAAYTGFTTDFPF
jgi:hypothetical protein